MRAASGSALFAAANNDVPGAFPEWLVRLTW
jgi:hypothetical protein